MSFGLKTYNNSNELTISSDGLVYGYIGQASLSSVAQATGNSIVKTFGRSTYTITWAGDIIVALPVKTNGTTALISMSQAGSTWTITVHKGNGTLDANGFDIQEATQVYVFGRPTAVSGFGLALYNAAGNLSADLTRQPLTYKARLSIAANGIDWTPPTTTTPAIIGSPSDRNITSVSEAPFFINRFQARGWQKNNSTGKIERNIFQQRWLKEDGAETAVDIIRSIDAILIEANGLA